MGQLHKRLDDKIVRHIFNQYDSKQLTLPAVLAQLGIGRSRFFKLLAAYRDNPAEFSIAYERNGRKLITDTAEKKIKQELLKEKTMIEDRSLPIKWYNYSAVRDVLKEKHNITVSVPTIIARAKEQGFYLPKPEKKKHIHEVITNYVGELVQHDASHHRWTPYSAESWTGITTIDDFSRVLLFGDLFEREGSFAHISSMESICLNYGVPAKYYLDQHRIFRFVRNRDSQSRFFNYQKFTDEIDPQFKQVQKDLHIDSTYALSPQAKGKIERPYQWLQDRVVRRCAKDHIIKFSEVREIFRDEVNRYNNRQVHSTTKEIPMMRLEAAINSGRTMFRRFSIPKPYQSTKDIFALRARRTVNHYQKISLNSLLFDITNVNPGQEVSLRIRPELETGQAEVRIWHKERFLTSKTILIKDITTKSGFEF
jgi:transposase